MQSIWQEKESDLQFPPLQQDLHTHVAIIGGGMAGILCAARFQEQGIDCALLESNTIGNGITARTTAVLSPQNELLYPDLIRMVGRKRASGYLHAAVEAIERYRLYAGRIPCDWEDMPAITYSLHHPDRMRKEAAVLRELGYPAEFITQTPLPFPVAGAVVYPGSAQFHPLKFLRGIAKGLPIYEKTKVLHLDGDVIVTENAHVYAKKIIIATHFPFINAHGLYFMKLHQKRSFVLALENAPKLSCTAVDEAENGIYLRNYGDLLLVGGGDRRPGKKGSGFSVVRDFVRTYYPQAREVTAWANQDCMSLDSLPYIGSYYGHNQHLFVTTGFNEWGMTGSMIGANLLVDLVAGKANRYEPVFAPNRHMPLLPLLQNTGAALLGWLTPRAPRCSHLGCALHWNEEEGAWECSCHGSRYRKNGTVIDNPATRGITTDQS